MKGPLVRPMPFAWFLKRPAYLLFMFRELTSLFIGAYLVLLLYILSRLGGGSYEPLRAVLQRPAVVVFHGLVFLAALLHSITWFHLTPKAVPLQLGEERVPGVVTTLVTGYLPWIAVSAFILWQVMG